MGFHVGEPGNWIRDPKLWKTKSSPVVLHAGL
jgi:hypothetical protein